MEEFAAAAILAIVAAILAIVAVILAFDLAVIWLSIFFKMPILSIPFLLQHCCSSLSSRLRIPWFPGKWSRFPPIAIANCVASSATLFLSSTIVNSFSLSSDSEGLRGTAALCNHVANKGGGFASALITTTVWEQHLRSHQKGATSMLLQLAFAPWIVWATMSSNWINWQQFNFENDMST